MQNHKYLEIQYNRQDILNVLRAYNTPEDNWADVSSCTVQEIQKISNILNLQVPIRSILYFRMGKSFIGRIHKDINNSDTRFVVNYALNLPLTSCKQVYMKWFTQNNNQAILDEFPGPSTGSPTPLLKGTDAKCIDSTSCVQSKLVKVDDWHSIENHSREDCEYLISIRFEFHIQPSMDLPMDKWLPRHGSNV